MRNLINLGKLLESINLDLDDEQDDIQAETPTLLQQQKTVNKMPTMIDFFVKKRLINGDSSPLTEFDKAAINALKNHPEQYYNIYTPENLNELKSIIRNGVEYLGNDGDYNWIDTSKMTSFISLFRGMTAFNGDITKWNTSNVKNMLNTFENAMRFDRDLSNWDVHNVLYMNSETFKGNSTLCQQFKKMKNEKKMPNLRINFS